ncbi:MAG TPA: DUF4080 domain-containing protein [Verrucomicrobiae bacterium]|nr:DUF4080 domain-containing protein [Verrucomicrobiae bacterium]
MPDIVLTTLNAKYIHAAFGLRYLMSNLGALQSRAAMVEFDINQKPLDIVDALLARNPRVIGFGVYIWNVTQTTQVVAAIKRLRPDIMIILGGPEVSYETQTQAIVHLADHVICGEADLKFAELCAATLQGHGPKDKILNAPLPDFSQIALPYDWYGPEDIAHRVIYLEASRGCPFSCEFCLSSLDVPVRQAPLPLLLVELRKLLDRGVRQFKFVDRTFNLNLAFSGALLRFFLENHQPGNFYHFEMIPDRLPSGLREIIAQFPHGALQFEVGIQTFNPEVAERISRRQDYARLEENLRFLREHTGVHVHADLIAGLPGESLESFADGFDKLISLGPQEIQVGILKRLRGTPIVRHDAEWQMVYDPNPPYEILQSRSIDFATMHELRRFARYWDIVGNSGNFIESAPLLWLEPRSGHGSEHRNSPFHSFRQWSRWLYTRIGRTDAISLPRLMRFLFDYLTVERRLPPEMAAQALWRDYQRGGRKDKPDFLKDFIHLEPDSSSAPPRSRLPKRQARHATHAPERSPSGRLGPDNSTRFTAGHSRDS